MNKCPKCGEELEDGAVFCTNCGTPLATTCPKCGKILKSGAKFCSGCGASLAELAKPTACPNCGAKLEEGAQFCDQCGHKIADNEEADKKEEVQHHTEKAVSDSQLQTENSNDFFINKTSRMNERTKPNLNVGTIGHYQHGKTTLTAAITAYSARNFGTREWSYDKINNLAKEQGTTVSHCYLEYESKHRHYTHIDCLGHVKYIKNMITGAALMDAAILVVSAPDSIMPQTREHILLARQAGVSKIIVFLNKTDLLTGSDLLELEEEEIRDVLESYGYPHDTPIIKGSAYEALYHGNAYCIDELLEVMDSYFDDPVRDEAKPFFMPIADVFTIPGRGTVVTGRIERGVVNWSDAIEIIGIKPTASSIAADIEIFQKRLDQGIAGDIVGILLRGIKKEDVVPGQVLARPGAVHPHTKFEAQICMASKEGIICFNRYDHLQFQFYFRTAEIEVSYPGGFKPSFHDDNTINVELDYPVAIEQGMKFAIRYKEEQTILIGQITNIIE